MVRAVVLQVISITVVTLLGVVIAATILEDVFLKKALSTESDFFWQARDENPLHPLPYTRNLVSYFVSADDPTFVQTSHPTMELPKKIEKLKTGYHRVKMKNNTPLIYVQAKKGIGKLYLLIDEQQLSLLSLYFGIIPLILALAGLYILSVFTHHFIRQAVSPISHLSNQMVKLDLSKPHELKIDPPDQIHYEDTEIINLYSGAEKLIKRVQSGLEREKRFTQDASHELRTPLAVIRGNLELVNQNINKVLKEDDDPKIQKACARVRRGLERAFRSTINMERLLVELLLLARENYEKIESETINCNYLVDTIAEELRAAYPSSPVKLKIDHRQSWTIEAPLSVLRVVVSNIATNAMKYTEKGTVTITTGEGYFIIKDTGIGLDKDTIARVFHPFSRGHHEDVEGFGLGLSIVKRFCDHYGWNIKVDSKVGVGTKFEIIIKHSTNTNEH